MNFYSKVQRILLKSIAFFTQITPRTLLSSYDFQCTIFKICPLSRHPVIDAREWREICCLAGFYNVVERYTVIKNKCLYTSGLPNESPLDCFVYRIMYLVHYFFTTICEITIIYVKYFSLYDGKIYTTLPSKDIYLSYCSNIVHPLFLSLGSN